MSHLNHVWEGKEHLSTPTNKPRTVISWDGKYTYTMSFEMLSALERREPTRWELAQDKAWEDSQPILMWTRNATGPILVPKGVYTEVKRKDRLAFEKEVEEGLREFEDRFQRMFMFDKEIMDKFNRVRRQYGR